MRRFGEFGIFGIMSHIRTPISLNDPFSLLEVKLRARVDHPYDDTDLEMAAHTAAAEIEARTGLALLASQITVTLDAWGDRIPLPVGPFFMAGLAGHPLTVQLRDDEGNLTPHPAGWWVEPGRSPVLNLTSKGTGAAILITYPAGFGLALVDIPADLRLAINDEATRLYDLRGASEAPQGLSLAAARVVGRYARVRV